MHFENRLRWERLRRHLSQEELAEALGVSPRSIIRWEQGKAIPHSSIRLQLSRFLDLRPEELFGDYETQKPATTLWNVPYPRNPFFTGQEKILSHLYEQFHLEHTIALTQPLAVSGLGGIGKTQIALEYAYRYRQNYSFVFWANASTREALLADFATIADLLRLPERNASDQSQMLQAVRQWLATHQNWLLILDNVDDIMLLQHFMPLERPGHLLLTSRAQALGSVAQRIEVEAMGLAEGTLFLLRRVKLLSSDAFLDQASAEYLTEAESIVINLAFLPLALDQAGAYIDEVGCSFSDYLELYRTHRRELLQRRGRFPIEHPESVATTWSLSFQQIERVNLTATNLLRLCAFLEPDAIPEELVGERKFYPGLAPNNEITDAFWLNEALEELRAFSLIQRNPETKMLRIHRLVQAVLKDSLGMEDQRRWAEQAIRGTNLLFPETVEMASWPLCQRFLPQAQACSALIQDYAFADVGAAALLSRTAAYLRVYALYEQAEALYRRALHIRKDLLGPQHIITASSLADLAQLLLEQGKYEQAKTLYQEALYIREQALGPEHPDVAQTLHGLALLDFFLEKHQEAESQYRRVLSIQERVLGMEHPSVASSLSELARLYLILGRDGEAEPLYQRALRIWEQKPGPEDPAKTSSLNGLAFLYYRQGKYEQSETLYRRALRILEQTLGPEHLETARPLNNLAVLYADQGKYEQAELLYWQALRIWEKVRGQNHPDVAFPLTNLAELCCKQRKYQEAESICKRAISILEQPLELDNPLIAFPLTCLAEISRAQGQYEYAEVCYLRALSIQEQTKGKDHPDVASVLHGLANLYYEQKQYIAAEAWYQRVLSIREQHLGQQHASIADVLHDFAALRETQGQSQEAASLSQRALAIREQVLGSDHPRTTETRTQYIALLAARSRAEKAD